MTTLYLVCTQATDQPDRVLFATADASFADRHAQPGDPNVVLVEQDTTDHGLAAAVEAVRADPNALTVDEVLAVAANAPEPVVDVPPVDAP